MKKTLVLTLLALTVTSSFAGDTQTSSKSQSVKISCTGANSRPGASNAKVEGVLEVSKKMNSAGYFDVKGKLDVYAKVSGTAKAAFNKKAVQVVGVKLDDKTFSLKPKSDKEALTFLHLNTDKNTDISYVEVSGQMFPVSGCNVK